MKHLKAEHVYDSLPIAKGKKQHTGDMHLHSYGFEHEYVPNSIFKYEKQQPPWS